MWALFRSLRYHLWVDGGRDEGFDDGDLVMVLDAEPDGTGVEPHAYVRVLHPRTGEAEVNVGALDRKVRTR